MKTIDILGVNINAVTMESTLKILSEKLKEIKGEYICVSNVHTTVMSYEDRDYKKIQNEAFMRLPDGKPLSIVGKRRGIEGIERVTGPDLMREIFKISEKKGYTHYFYGSTEDTLKKLEKELKEKYPGIEIKGMYSPPFRELTEDEDKEIVEMLNSANADFLWVGLGAPKQEIWMSAKKGKIKSLMLGVGAGFDYHANKIKRAPKWMQSLSLEWLYRLLQDPKRLWKRYYETNVKFIKYLNTAN